MNTKLASSLAVICFTVLAGGLGPTAGAQRRDHRDVPPQSATLLSQIAHKDFAKANFNFQLGVRGDSVSPPTRNVYDLRFGGFSYDGDNDWLEVPIERGSRSKIIDMGASNWADVFDVPFLHANPVPYDGVRTISPGKGTQVNWLPENTMVKAVVGHMYLLRAKSGERDFYVMFRVESLKAGDEVSISWKVVPSPENG